MFIFNLVLFPFCKLTLHVFIFDLKDFVLKFYLGCDVITCVLTYVMTMFSSVLNSIKFLFRTNGGHSDAPRLSRTELFLFFFFFVFLLFLLFFFFFFNFSLFYITLFFFLFSFRCCFSCFCFLSCFIHLFANFLSLS